MLTDIEEIKQMTLKKLNEIGNPHRDASTGKYTSGSGGAGGIANKGTDTIPTKSKVVPPFVSSYENAKSFAVKMNLPSPDAVVEMRLKRGVPALSMVTDTKDKIKIEALHRYVAYSGAYYQAVANSSSTRNKALRDEYAKKAKEIATGMNATKEHAIKSGATNKEIGSVAINNGRSALVITKEFGEFHIYTVPGENKSLKRW
jgi:hypothetical protein